MQIQDLDERLRRLTTTLAQLLAGEYDAIAMDAQFRADLLGRIEETVMFLVMDIKTVTLANRDKETVLLLQQAQLAEQERELAAKLETIEQQAAAIRRLSTPILEVWKDVLVVPIIGIVDARRSSEVLADLLDAIARMQTKWVILDVTGVGFVDATTADRLLAMMRAAGLLGARCLLSGIQPAVAQTLVQLGADLGELETKRNLADALHHCILRVNGDT
jgi:rsbT co-antagonist protein RsbR